MYIPTGFALARYCHTAVGDAEEMMVTLGHDVSASPGSQQDVVDQLRDLWETLMVPMLLSDYTFTRALVSFGAGEGDPLTLEAASNTAGGAGGSPLPPNCAVLVRKLTASGGRANRGRMYLPGFVAEGSVGTDGLMAGGSLTALQTGLDNYYDGLLAANDPLDGYDPVVLHGGAVPAPTPITQFVVQQRLATQRRRLRP